MLSEILNLFKQGKESARSHMKNLIEMAGSKEEKFSQLYDLVHMMSIDKNIHDEELKLCNLFAVKFGYERNKVKELIESIQLNIGNGNKAEEAFKRVAFLIN